MCIYIYIVYIHIFICIYNFNICLLTCFVYHTIGITYDFDSHGVNRSFHGWSQVLAVDLADYLDEEKSALWNSKLHEFTGYECWLPERLVSLFTRIANYMLAKQYTRRVKHTDHK